MSPHSQVELSDDSSAASRGETILVVDDYPSFCEVVAAILRPCGYHVLVAFSGEEAQIIVAREGATIDLLLTDIEMPQMGGHELAEWFHAQKPTRPILFMSNQARARKSIEPRHFLQKPFLPEELVSKVRDLCESSSAAVAKNNSPSDYAN